MRKDLRLAAYVCPECGNVHTTHEATKHKVDDDRGATISGFLRCHRCGLCYLIAGGIIMRLEPAGDPQRVTA